MVSPLICNLTFGVGDQALTEKANEGDELLFFFPWWITDEYLDNVQE